MSGISTDFISCALEYYFKCGTPVEETLELLKRLRIAIPKMKRIWSESGQAKRGFMDQVFAQTLETEKKLLDAVASGQFSLDDKVLPDWTVLEHLRTSNRADIYQ